MSENLTVASDRLKTANHAHLTGLDPWQAHKDVGKVYIFFRVDVFI